MRGARALLPGRDRDLEGAFNVGHHSGGDGPGLLRAIRRLCDRLRLALRRTTMTFDYWLAAPVTAGLLVYLVYALLRPERF